MNVPKRVRALVVEDDYWAGEMIKSLLQEAGFVVVGKAASGGEAIEMLENLRGSSDQPDVVLMDIEMPGVNGIEATRRIQTQCPTPVVILTAYETDDLIAQASEAGAGAYLVKPPDISEVKRAVSVAIARFDDMMALYQSNRRLEETLAELRAAQKQLVRHERLAAVGQLAAGIAHEYNNLMASVILHSDMMLIDVDLPPQVRERVAVVRRQGEQAAFLTQQILDFGRKTILRMQKVDLGSLLQEVALTVEHALPGTIQLHQDFVADQIVIHADPDRVRQAILNLVDNAREAMPEGGDLRLALDRMHVETGEAAPLPKMEPGNWARLSVADTGVGIPPDVLAHIFEPFFTTRAPLGSGMGLAQVYGIVRQHRGHIDVQTEVGQGSTFALYFPASTLAKPAPPGAAMEPTPEGQGELVLVIERDPLLCDALVDALQSLNYNVLAAANVRDALDLIGSPAADPQATPPEDVAVMLCDLNQGDASEMLLCRALTQRQPRARLVVLTDLAPDQFIGRVDLEGIAGWLKKPVSLEHLAEMVAQVLKGD